MPGNGNPFGSGPLFSPSIVRRLASENVAFKDMTIDNMSQSFLSPTASFTEDAPGSGLKSTQQIPVDWSSDAIQEYTIGFCYDYWGHGAPASETNVVNAA